MAENLSYAENLKKKKSHELLRSATAEAPLPIFTLASDLAKKMIDGILNFLGIKTD